MADEIKTFDEILADPTYKAEFDRRITKALSTVQSKLDAEVEKNKQFLANGNAETDALKKEIEGYKSAGIIAGGMIPKIGGMADAIYQGVHEAVIIDGRVPHSILLELFSNRGSGTRFYRRSHRE